MLAIEGLIYQSPYQDCELNPSPVCQLILEASQSAFSQIPAGLIDLQYYTLDPPDSSVEQLPALLLVDLNGMVLGRLEGNQLTANNVQALLLSLAEYSPDGQGGYTNGEGGIINAGQELQLLPGLGFGLNLKWPTWSKITNILIGVAATALVDNFVKSQSK